MYDVYKPTVGTVFTAGSYNIRIGVEGNYDITFDSSDPNHPEDIVFKGNSGGAALTSAKNEDGLGSAGITAWRSGKHYIYKSLSVKHFV